MNDADVIILVTRRELVAPARERLARARSRAASTTVSFASGAAIAREILVARRGVPTTGVVVVAANGDEAETALALGADEVLVGLADDALVRAVERASLRALARDTHLGDGQVLAQVLTGVVRRVEAPITALALDLEAYRSLADGVVSEDAVALLDDCMTALDDLASALRDAGLFARAEATDSPVPLDIRALIDQVLRVLGGAIGLRAHVERDEARPLTPVLAPRTRLARALAGAVVHALTFVDEKAEPEALRKLRVSVREEANTHVVSIEATSAGRLGVHATRAADPSGPLRMLRDAVRLFGGEVAVEVGPRGAKLELAVPREQRAVVALGSTHPPRGRTPAQPTILLVDPDDRVLRATARALADLYEVIVATTGEEALDLAREQTVALAVVNARLPDVSARLLLDELRHTRGGQGARAVLVASQDEIRAAGAPPVGRAGRQAAATHRPPHRHRDAALGGAVLVSRRYAPGAQLMAASAMQGRLARPGARPPRAQGSALARLDPIEPKLHNRA